MGIKSRSKTGSQESYEINNERGDYIMRSKSNPWVLLIGAGIMGAMLLICMSGNIAVRTHTLATQNQRMELNMKQEFKQMETSMTMEATNEDAR